VDFYELFPAKQRLIGAMISGNRTSIISLPQKKPVK